MAISIDRDQLDWNQVLLARLAAPPPARLEAYLEEGGFLGVNNAARSTPLETATLLRDCGLRGRGVDARPVFLKWWDFIQGPGPKILAVDAREPDPRSLAGEALLDRNPFGLLEGLLIAALASGARRVKVLAAPHLADRLPALEKGLAEVRAWDLVPGLDLTLEASGPEAESAAEGGSILSHSLETWYHVTLALSLGASWYAARGQNGQSGTRLMTVGGEVARPGLVEVPMGAHLWQALDGAGGLKDIDSFLALSLDDGVSGFLSLEQAAAPLAPEEMMDLGVSPGAGTVWALDRSQDPPAITVRALRRIGELGLEAGPAARELSARAADLAEDIRRGRAGAGALERLEGLGEELRRLGAMGARPLGSSLAHFHSHWERLAG